MQIAVIYLLFIYFLLSVWKIKDGPRHN